MSILHGEEESGGSQGMGDCCGHEERITGSLEVAEFAAEKEPSTYVTFAYVHSRISRYVRRVSV
jgi:hypothetical protein